MDDGMVALASTGEARRLWVDVHEVTVAEFTAFVDSARFVTDAERLGAFSYRDGPFRGVRRPTANWRTAYVGYPAVQFGGRLPVTCVSFDDARAFARWRGKRLPRVDEFDLWLSRCRGGSHGRSESRIERGNVADGSLLRAWGVFHLASLQGGVDDGFAFVAPVGSMGSDSCGLFDVRGNVAEWAVDSEEQGGSGAICGGSWLGLYIDEYGPNSSVPMDRHHASELVGFRCVRDEQRCTCAH